MLLASGALLAVLLPAVCGQTTHQVIVGLKGNFYDPPFLSASVGDTVQFSFSGIFHGVTQSTFEAPCTPMPGGFSSGLAGTAGNTSIGPPIWNLMITNASTIYYFCEATQPESHCAAGMVGAINVQSPDMYTSFQSSAKAVTGTPKPTPTLILSGLGAFATAAPSTPLLTTTSTSTSASSASTVPSTVSPTETPSPTPSPAKSSVSGGTIGGAVGGGLAVIVVGFLALYCLRRRKRPSHPGAEDEKVGRSMGNARPVAVSADPFSRDRFRDRDRDRDNDDRSSWPKADYASPSASDAGSEWSPNSPATPPVRRGESFNPLQATHQGRALRREAARSDDELRNRRPGTGTTSNGLSNHSNTMSEDALASLMRSPTYASRSSPPPPPVTHPYNPYPGSGGGNNTGANAQNRMLVFGGQSHPGTGTEDIDDYYYDHNGTRSQHYTDARVNFPPPPPPAMPASNVHEIAKEVAALLRPTLRSSTPPPEPAPSNPVPPVPVPMPMSMAHVHDGGQFGSVNGRARRQLPVPRRYSPSSIPPEYES